MKLAYVIHVADSKCPFADVLRLKLCIKNTAVKHIIGNTSKSGGGGGVSPTATILLKEELPIRKRDPGSVDSDELHAPQPSESFAIGMAFHAAKEVQRALEACLKNGMVYPGSRLTESLLGAGLRILRRCP